MTAPALKKFTFLISFRNGTTRTETRHDTDAKSARELVWKMLEGKDQERSPTITLLTSSEASE
jgi:hypothetical protein